MRDRFDPSQLEPKNGDFADFIDKLNQKSAEELKALQVNDALMREHSNELQQSVADAHALQRQTMETKLGQTSLGNDYAWGKTDQSGPVIQNLEEAFRVDPTMQRTPVTTRRKKKSQSPIVFAIFMCFGLFAYGGATGQEHWVIAATAAMFFLILANAVFQIIRNKRR